MITVTLGEAYQNLANAIVEQAAKDYIAGYKRQDCLEFFRSQWFTELTDIPGSVIIKECNKQIEENRNKIRHYYRKRGM